MKKLIDFLGGCCVTLFFLVTYQIMRGINSYKDCRERIRGMDLAGKSRRPYQPLPAQPPPTPPPTVKTLSQDPCRKGIPE
jgi:hypothetical protein